jgi:hypothetical protein
VRLFVVSHVSPGLDSDCEMAEFFDVSTTRMWWYNVTRDDEKFPLGLSIPSWPAECCSPNYPVSGPMFRLGSVVGGCRRLGRWRNSKSC